MCIYIYIYNCSGLGVTVAWKLFMLRSLGHGRFPKFHRVFWAETLAH